MKTTAVLVLAALFVLAAIAAERARRSNESVSLAAYRSATTQPVKLVGHVVAAGQPVVGARVRMKGHANFAITDAMGHFELPGKPAEGDTVTAAKEGHFIASLPATTAPLELQLTPLPLVDCAEYEWIDPTPNADAASACGNCHQAIYHEWRWTGHAQSAVNRRFKNLIDGTDWQGKPGHGWSLVDEYPEGVGVCWSCHAPSLDETTETFNLTHVEGVAAAGVHCDFCHKIRATNVEQAGVTHGRFGYDLLRPAKAQLFFGPLDDVDRGEDAYSPLQTESRFCAACHEGTLFGVPVYTTWSEWLISPAAREGRQCQSCHMTPSGTLTNLAPTSGGIERDPATLASHSFLPGGREAMLRRALSVSFTGTRSACDVGATVTIRVQNVGHRLPTGFIDRHLVLFIESFDDQRQPTEVLSGPRLSATAGANLAGKAGQLYAKLLTDAEGEAPAPFWRRGISIADNRLAPDEGQSLEFRFSSATAKVRLRLIYRRFWPDVTKSKQWPDDETIVIDRWFEVAPGASPTELPSRQ